MLSLLQRTAPFFALCLTLVLGGCMTNPERNVIDVSVVGVNYTDNDYSIEVHAMDGSQGVRSGELTPYSAGGSVCCFALPATWQPGLQVKVRGLRAVVVDGRWIKDDITETVVDVPPYNKEELGTLWLLQLPETKVEIVNSTVGPAHEQWPAKTKGWPVPSKAFMNAKIQKEIAEKMWLINESKETLQKLEADPTRKSNQIWKEMQSYRSEFIEKYKGPGDPRFIPDLKNQYNEWIKEHQATIEKLRSKLK